MDNPITIQTNINAPADTIWECWTLPKHINGWAFASEDWEAHAEQNNLVVGESFKTVMSAKDGSATFDFMGTYTSVEKNKQIEYDMEDGRHVSITFEETPEYVKVTQTFDPEKENPEEMQRAGWQAILDNFKKYVENLAE